MRNKITNTRDQNLKVYREWTGDKTTDGTVNNTVIQLTPQSSNSKEAKIPNPNQKLSTEGILNAQCR